MASKHKSKRIENVNAVFSMRYEVEVMPESKLFKSL